MESQNLDHGCIKDQWPYPNHNQDAKPQSGASSFLQSPNCGLKGHRCSLHLQNQDRVPKFYTKDRWPYSNHNQDAKPHSGTFTLLQCPNQDSNNMFKVNSLWQSMPDLEEIWKKYEYDSYVKNHSFSKFWFCEFQAHRWGHSKCNTITKFQLILPKQNKS